MVKYRLIVYGKVQGVGFRFYTQQKAALYQISGWVSNNDNGTVEIVAEGSPDQMKKFIEAVKKGPLYSHVERIEYSQENGGEHNRKFIIKY